MEALYMGPMSWVKRLLGSSPGLPGTTMTDIVREDRVAVPLLKEHGFKTAGEIQAMETLSHNAVTRLGLGCRALGGDQWGPQDDRTSREAIQTAYQEGITHFDTAQLHGRGHGEELG
jgi:hypothetical protein